ncbi:MAG: Fur family transcriptional regulator [Candidatus Bipolaricaulaceae bacterium]
MEADPREVFVSFLRREGLHVTRTRLAVLQGLAQLPKHFEAAELWGALRPRVSAATVYRTLELLERAGLVRKVEFGEAHAHYERVFGREDHGHLVCRRCGRVGEFAVGAARRAVEQAAHALGFALGEVVIQGYGLCPQCRAQEDPRV